MPLPLKRTWVIYPRNGYSPNEQSQDQEGHGKTLILAEANNENPSPGVVHGQTTRQGFIPSQANTLPNPSPTRVSLGSINGQEGAHSSKKQGGDGSNLTRREQ